MKQIPVILSNDVMNKYMEVMAACEQRFKPHPPYLDHVHGTPDLTHDEQAKRYVTCLLMTKEHKEHPLLNNLFNRCVTNARMLPKETYEKYIGYCKGVKI